MVRILHRITNIIEPWMNERLETLAGIYAAAVKIYLNDIVHALTMSIIRRIQAKIGSSLPHNVVHVGYVDYYYSRVQSGCIIACRHWLHFRNILQPGYSCRPAA